MNIKKENNSIWSLSAGCKVKIITSSLRLAPAYIALLLSDAATALQRDKAHLASVPP